jgi:two-component system sporulation sensor kinase A
LAGLLKEILLYANPGNGHLECVNLRALVEEILATLRASSDGTFGNIRVSLAEAQLQVRANADKLRQVIINLLSNACEASPAREPVHLAIGPVDDSESVRLCVRNVTTGDPPDTERILEPFYTTKSSGTGLGLPIVKRIVDALKGEFSIQQDENGEVRAEVTLPCLAL